MYSLDSPEVTEALGQRASEADENDKARFLQSTVALFRLSKATSSTSRKSLFAPVRGYKVTAAVSRMTTQLNWTKDFLQHLLDQGLIQQTQPGYYFAPDSAKESLADLAATALLQDDESLKKILWPQDYGDPLEEGVPEEEAEGGGEKSGLDLLQGLTQELSNVVPHMENIYKNLGSLAANTADLATNTGTTLKQVNRLVDEMESLTSNLTTVTDRISASVKALENLGQTLEQKVVRFDALLERTVKIFEEDHRHQLQSIHDRLIEQAAKKNSLLNQLASGDRQDEKLRVELDALLKKGAS